MALRVNSRRANKLAGYRNPETGRTVVSINKQKYMASRVIWKMVHNEEPAEVDHVDVDPSNDRLSNLRPAGRSDNQLNIPGWCVSGLKGAYFNKRQKRWYSRITQEGHDVFLGMFDNPEDAHQAYAIAAKLAHGEFARINHKSEAA